MTRTIILKTNSQSHKEAVRLVADALNARTYANRAIGEGLATPGMRAAFSAEIARKTRAAQPSLKAARAEAKAAKTAKAKSEAISAHYHKIATTYVHYTNLQLGAMGSAQ